jgi:uncharacterized protein YndB with AHSA1/START domain
MSTTLIITRRFEAPPERVFNAWLDPRQLSRWMGPRGVQAEATKLDARVGGEYAITMHTPDQKNPRVGGIYKEIVRSTRLVFTWMWAHETDGMQETLVTLTFKPVGNGTEMTLEHTGFANAERRDSHNNGWTGSFDKLGELLAG